jgi:hypothetical protein
MRNRTCYCQTQNERDLCALRDKLSDGHECPSLAPWERELYSMVEPHVDLSVHVDESGKPLTFQRVRGVKYADNVLTFESDNGSLFFVPNVKYWVSDASDY